SLEPPRPLAVTTTNILPHARRDHGGRIRYWQRHLRLCDSRRVGPGPEPRAAPDQEAATCRETAPASVMARGHTDLNSAIGRLVLRYFWAKNRLVRSGN